MNSIHTLQATDFNSRIFEIIRKDDITLEKESNDVSVFDTNLNRNILENSLKQIKSRIEEINVLTIFINFIHLSLVYIYFFFKNK